MGEVSQNLDAFLADGLPNYLKQAMVAACAQVQETATGKAPKDTGNLARSIDFDVEEDGKEGVVYSNCEYAPYVEIGTGIHSSKGTGRKKPWSYKGKYGWVTTSGNNPQPFMQPALDENKSSILEKFEGLF